MLRVTAVFASLRLRAGIAVLALVLAHPALAANLEAIKLPPGFSIEIYASGVPNARQIARSPNGTLFVGTREEGKVYAVVDTNGDNRADRVYTLATGLFMPSGVAFKDGALYVAEVNRVLRYDDIEQHLERPPAPVVVTDQLPGETHHGWKFIAFGPDGKLYVPVGAPCNICDREPPFASMLRMNADGSQPQVYARGIRNSVGFAWDPASGDLWFTDNGRDYLGDDLPPCELNHASGAGQHFGFPYFHGGDIPDPEFGAGKDPHDYAPPAQRLGPHVAPLGILFYTGTQFPPEYRSVIFIAEHGSWNRSRKIGYRVTMARLDAQRKVVAYEPFATGWQVGNAVSGRPVALAQLPDGSLLLSDDQAGVIYRIAYKEPVAK